MDHAASGWDPEKRRRILDAFYELTAREVMDPTLERAVLVPPHFPVEDLFEIFLGVDHAWVRAAPEAGRRVTSILLRHDLLRSLEPTHASYSRFSRVRFRSLAHGSADCVCCFAEGRVLHPVAPAASCRDVLFAVEAKGVLYVPVMEAGELLGEIGPIELFQAIRRLRGDA